jgi:hypothetical protein
MHLQPADTVPSLFSESMEYNGNMTFNRSTSLSDIATGPASYQPQAL